MRIAAPAPGVPDELLPAPTAVLANLLILAVLGCAAALQAVGSDLYYLSVQENECPRAGDGLGLCRRRRGLLGCRGATEKGLWAGPRSGLDTSTNLYVLLTIA